ncbi:hypothetical protein [Halobacterium salinarum]|uniref:hypothetical protein n=1 Tax=Halobacterium salinarum TaxID=2242 RepID=UPI002553C773|nr:hypothetical protein [Halobacterium salinarum]MDL0121770.1 hypothetical protein [Halobacterium salinarum]
MSENVRHPQGEEQEVCAICAEPLYEIALPLTSAYPNVVCKKCERRAVNENGDEPKHGVAYEKRVKAESDDPESISFTANPGDNPVFIDGNKCWRRYRHGGYITRLDQFDCDDIWEFREKHEG